MTKTDPFQATGIEREVVANNVLLEHLSGFIHSFIEESYIQRIETLLNREYWSKVSREIEKHLKAEYCQHWEKQSRPEAWNEKYSNNTGVYISNKSEGYLMKIEQASKLSLYNCEDAIFSINAGKTAIFLNHDWGVWYCENT